MLFVLSTSLLDHTTESPAHVPDTGEKQATRTPDERNAGRKKEIVENLSEQVGVGASVYKLQYKSMVVLQPN